MMKRFGWFGLVGVVAILSSGCAEDGEYDPKVLGLWGGDTAGCSDEADNGMPFRVSVQNGPDSPGGDEYAFVSTTLGADQTVVTACSGSPAKVDGYAAQAKFTYIEQCEPGGEAKFDVNLIVIDADSLGGDVTFSGSKTCNFSLTRVR